MELVVPKRMSGLTGSSDRREAAPHALVGPTKPAAAVNPLQAMADERNSRLLSPRSVTFVDIRHFLAGKLFDVLRNRNWVSICLPLILQRLERLARGLAHRGRR